MSDAEIWCVLREHSENNLVMLTVTDSPPEYAELLENWLCHARRLELDMVVWASDADTHQRVLARGAASIFSASLSLPATAQPGQFKRPGDAAYMAATAMKPAVMLKVLQMGFDLLYLDVDVAVNVDPRPWFARHHADLQVSLNYPEAVLNSGVMHVRSTDGTRGIFMQWVKDMAQHCGDWGCVDQEKLTALVVRCGWRPIGEAAQAAMLTNDQQNISCAELTGAEHVRLDSLPIRFFGDGKSEDLLREAMLPGPQAEPAALGNVFTYHPNFSGFGQGGKKEKLQNLVLGGRSMWCLGPPKGVLRQLWDPLPALP